MQLVLFVTFAAAKSIIMNHDIFISYSRKDSKTVDEFVSRLEAEGFRIWIDRDGIESGDAFKRVIVRAIKESAIVAFFSSEYSNTSPWTAKEINIAVHYDKPIIPIKLDKTVYNDEVEFDLVSLDYIDYTDPAMRPAMMEKMVRTVKARVPERWEEICKAKMEMESQRQQPLVEQAQPLAQENKTVVQANPLANNEKSKSKKGLWIALGIVAAAIVALLLLLPKLHQSGQSTSAGSQTAYTDLNFTVKGVDFVMKPVEGEAFMTCGTEDRPAHHDSVGTFYLGETEVTQALWKAVMGSEPVQNGGWTAELGLGDNYPAYEISWSDIQSFLRKLNTLTNKEFRLPTEAEWEFAALGGKKANGYLYAGSPRVEEVAWHNKNSQNVVHEVKQLKPNELGLYDMSGNVWEWCSDLYEESANDEMRVLRGGGWNRSADRCQVAFRGKGGPYFRGNSHGFRLALSIE